MTLYLCFTLMPLGGSLKPNATCLPWRLKGHYCMGLWIREYVYGLNKSWYFSSEARTGTNSMIANMEHCGSSQCSTRWQILWVNHETPYLTDNYFVPVLWSWIDPKTCDYERILLRRNPRTLSLEESWQSVRLSKVIFCIYQLQNAPWIYFMPDNQ